MQMLKYLYLDDRRTPDKGDWIIARNYDEFKKIINYEGLENFKAISLDHDLGINEDLTENTGFDCANFLIDLCLFSGKKLPQIYTHSDNIGGSDNIINLINRWLLFNDLPQTCCRVSIPYTIEE